MRSPDVVCCNIKPHSTGDEPHHLDYVTTHMHANRMSFDWTVSFFTNLHYIISCTIYLYCVQLNPKLRPVIIKPQVGKKVFVV